MREKFNRNLLFGYGASLLILFAVGLLALLSLTGLLKSNRSVAHSTMVMQKLEQTLSYMKDAETGERGYLLTGQRTFLEPYSGAVQKALTLTGQLDSLTADNHVQQKNIAAIRQIITERLDILQEQIKLREIGRYVTTADLSESKIAMDALRDAVAKTEMDEQHLLDARAERLDYYTALAPVLIVVGLAFAIIIAIVSYFRAVREVREKDRLYRELQEQEEETATLNEELAAANEEVTAANEELTASNEELLEARGALADANESLELKVEERTRALADSEQQTQALNEELTAINEELAAANEELQTTNEELAENKQRLQQLVNELIQAEERSAKMAAIVESSDDAIIGKTLQGVITSWNRGAEHIFGYTEDEMIGESIFKLIPQERHHEEPEIIDRIKSGERIEHHETVRRTADGRLIDVSLTISPIKNKADQIIGISKIARDITERKRDEQRKNDFIGMASHELKTPLTSLTGFIQIVQQKLRDHDDPFITGALEKAGLQTRKMTALINGFLNVSRLESGKLLIEKHPFDLNNLVTEMIGEITFSVSSHTFIFEPEGAINVVADRDKVGVVISNLLSNAVKYSPGGKIVNIATVVHNGEALLSIRDEGMGINPKDIDKLFERYYRVQSEHTRQISGFGVGLYLCAEIIERHGGRIWVESERGLGSTFHFTLPLASA